MAKRILLVLTSDRSADRASAALAASRLARESGGAVRMMYTQPMPAARVDRHDRVVADTDREMARIAAAAEDELRRLAADLDDVPVERVVRFGGLVEEVAIEADAFGADLVALAAPARPGLRHEFLAWYLEWKALGSKIPVMLLPSPPEHQRLRDAIAVAGLRPM